MFLVAWPFSLGGSSHSGILKGLQPSRQTTKRFSTRKPNEIILSYDDPPIDPPPQSNFPEDSPNPAPTRQHLFTERPTTIDIELVQPDASYHVATDHVDDLEEVQPLPDSTEVQL